MRTDFKVYVKRAIARSGLPASYRLEYLNALLKFGRWIRDNPPMVCFDDRIELYSHLNSHLLHNEPIRFLEFGVYQGASLREWVRLNTHADSRFWGFDSFTGLPEPWRRFTGTTAAGAFDLNGSIPDIPDRRVRLVKGYFQDTLTGFFETQHAVDESRLVIHCDADLYSSTLYVLATVNRVMVPGTIIVFDEFSSVLHEFRAFSDFLESFRRQARGVAAAGPFYSRVAVEIVK
jgi:hypothetical protein